MTILLDFRADLVLMNFDHIIGHDSCPAFDDSLLLRRYGAGVGKGSLGPLYVGFEVYVLPGWVGLNCRENFVLFYANAFEPFLPGSDCRRQSSGADPDYGNGVFNVLPWAFPPQVFLDPLYYLCALVHRILDQRHPRDVADHVYTGDVGQERFGISFRHLTQGDLTLRIDNFAGGRRTCGLAAGVVHALRQRDGYGDFVEGHREHIVRTRLDAGVASDTKLRVDLRIRISREA